MKPKFIIVMALLVLSFSFAKAQDSLRIKFYSAPVYKQVAGDKSFEVNFNPGGIFGSNQGGQFNLFNGGIKYRTFVTDKKAYRIGVNISYYNHVDIFQHRNPAYRLLELRNKFTSFSILLTPGFERHFAATKRLSPYVGAQALAGYSTTVAKREIQDNNEVYNVTNKNNPGRVRVGVGIFAGIDYYFIKKMYLGIELGYGIEYDKYLNTKYTNEKFPDQNYNHKNGHSIGVSPSLFTRNLRLGWTF
ncbi:MAG: hypothetical protein IEMM0006_0267 [bacterium]|nr:MAG: hypothetical protein IEMM0006_0267 [bacterium]